MPDLLIVDKSFEAQKYTTDNLKKAEYDSCIFKDCDFSESDLSEIVFSECRFENCNFSMVRLVGTSLKDIYFINCKLVGVSFADCNDFLFEVTFENCTLNLASFFKMDIAGTLFKNCSLHEADFTESNLQEAVFDDCDLQDAVFERTNLQRADFSSAYNYSINPEINPLENARFSLSGLPGLLQKYNIQIE